MFMFAQAELATNTTQSATDLFMEQCG